MRQLTDADGAVTLARTYDPYGTVNTSSGAGSSTYGFASEYQSGDSVYLRSRFYTPSTGRFLTRDTWNGDANRPLSLNRWAYVEGNPVNLTDPLGLCPNCFVFFFPGAGNQGDTNNNGNMDDDDLGMGEAQMVQDLRSRTGATVIPIYPYGAGVGGNIIKDNIFEAIIPTMKQKSNIPWHKAQEIIARLLGDDIFACYNSNYGVGQFDDNLLEIAFIAYSGGGQMAYSTAQELDGKLVVDNLILFGSPVIFHKGMGNIDTLWSFFGTQDSLPLIRSGAWSLTTDKWTFCELFGDDESPYIHYDEHHNNDYFDVNPGKFNGSFCFGKYPEKSISREVAAKSGLSHYEANLVYFVNIITGTSK